MKRLLTRLLALGATLSGAGMAASGCTSVYALTTTGINWVNPQSGAVTGTYTTTFTGINGAALNPATGELYFIDRSAATTNTLYRYNPQTPAVAPVQVGPVTIPTRNGTSVNVGASFDNSTGTPKLYLMYGNYVLQEVNTATGATVRNIDINLGNGPTNTTTITNGDIVFVGTTLYILLDGIQGGTSGMFYANFGTVPATGTTALTSTSAVRLTSGGTNVATGVYNGISYDPVTTRTVLSAGGATGGTRLLNTTTGAVTDLAALANLTDMTGCGNAPDAPTITKSFSSAAVVLGQNSRVTLTIGNTNPSPYYLTSALTDTLPSGLAVAATPAVTTTCTSSTGGAATVTATANSGSVTLAAGTRIPGVGGCTLSFDVSTTSLGAKVNSIAAGGLVATSGTNASAGSATLTVNNAITGTLTKTQRNVTQNGTLVTTNVNAKPGETVEYCLTATHAGTGYADATVATLRDIIPTPLTLLTGGYGTGQDVRLKRNAGAYTYTTFAATYTAGTRTLSINILPFTAGTTLEACFQAKVP